jgi:hypothetical protein
MQLDDLVLELSGVGRHLDTFPWPFDHCDGVRKTGGSPRSTTTD